MSKNAPQKSVQREYIEAIIIAAILAIFIRTFIVQAFKIPSGSMLPTLQIGDHLLVTKFYYGVKIPFTNKTLIPFNNPERGDIIVFKYPQNKKIDYIKRVIGVPGDTLQIKDKKVFINGAAIDDPNAYYLDQHINRGLNRQRDNYGPVTVPEGHIFVMGDNRDNSQDSRYWGYVDQRDIRGKALIIYWSWDVNKPLLSFERFSSIRWNRFADLIR